MARGELLRSLLDFRVVDRGERDRSGSRSWFRSILGSIRIEDGSPNRHRPCPQKLIGDCEVNLRIGCDRRVGRVGQIQQHSDSCGCRLGLACHAKPNRGGSRVCVCGSGDSDFQAAKIKLDRFRLSRRGCRPSQRGGLSSGSDGSGKEHNLFVFYWRIVRRSFDFLVAQRRGRAHDELVGRFRGVEPERLYDLFEVLRTRLQSRAGLGVCGSRCPQAERINQQGDGQNASDGRADTPRCSIRQPGALPRCSRGGGATVVRRCHRSGHSPSVGFRAASPSLKSVASAPWQSRRILASEDSNLTGEDSDVVDTSWPPTSSTPIHFGAAQRRRHPRPPRRSQYGMLRT